MKKQKAYYEYDGSPFYPTDSDGTFLGNFNLVCAPEYGKEMYDVWIEEILDLNTDTRKKFVFRFVNCNTYDHFVRDTLRDLTFAHYECELETALLFEFCNYYTLNR